MKLLVCPQCGEKGLRDSWVPGRKLQQSCYECIWEGEARIPEQKLIESVKELSTSQFGGLTYEIFDRYGHILYSSSSFYDRDKVVEEIKVNLNQGRNDKNAGPYTAILWPDVVCVEGEVFR